MSNTSIGAGRSFVVAVPAYNEAGAIKACLDSICVAAENAKEHGYKFEKAIVCINGCTDETEAVVRGYTQLPLELIVSEAGYIKAMNALLQYVRRKYPQSFIVKTDADAMIAPDSLLVLFSQFARHPKMLVVGGHPYPLIVHKTNAVRRFLASVLSVRSRTPEAEVTTTDTRRFHPYAVSDPIPELNGREELLKIYFHGRLWCARSARCLPNLPTDVIGDDVYFPGWLLHHHGFNSMRLDYRAKVFFYPNDSLIRHWRVYRRIHEDRRLVYGIKGFEGYARACPLKLDWRYILTHTRPREVLQFALYASIVFIERLTYRFIEYKPAYWQYEQKEG